MSAEPHAPRPPGVADAGRATVGVVCAYGAALVLAGLVALVSGAANDGIRSAGDTRAQLAIQGVIFTGAALLLVEGLRLAHRPGERDPLAAASRDRSVARIGLIVAFGVAAAAAGLLVGPLVSAVLPGLHDGQVPVGDLGIGKGAGADIGTAIVVAGLVPFGEELLFRGVLVGAWVRAGRPLTALALSALLFGFAHVTVGPRAVAITILLGVVLALAMLGARSLGAAVLAHGIINAAALIDAGLRDPLPLAALIVTVVAASAAATRISRSVSLPPPAGTLVR